MNTFHMNGKEVFKFAVRVLGRSVMKALDKIGMTKMISTCRTSQRTDH